MVIHYNILKGRQKMKNITKKLCATMLSICLLATILMCIPTTAHAAGGTYGNLSWDITNGTLTISGYGDMPEGYSSDYPWYNKSFTTVDIRSGVTSIAPYAFFCHSISCMYIPLSVRNIGHRATYLSGQPDIYYAGSLEDRKALLSWGEMNHGVAQGTWHYSSHSHQWTLKSTTSATCTANGANTYSCHCGSTRTEQLSALGHNYSGSVSYNWTQTNGSYRVTANKYCVRNCGQSITETVTAQQTEIKAATCTASGQIQCTATFSNSAFSTQVKTFSTPPIGHTYKDTVTPPTCTEKGFTTHTCHCGHSYVDSYVDALGHKWNNGVITTQPTCTQKGVKTYTCTTCSSTKTEPVDPAGHTYKDAVTAPTCTEKGFTTHTCHCGHSYVDSYVDALGHKWNSGAVTKQPTCKEEGIKTYTCLVCSETKTETIEKLKIHTYDNDCDAICNVCNASRPITHQYNSNRYNDEVSCWYECTVCGEKKDVMAHIPGAEATETMPQVCTNCGYIIKPATGHITHKYEAKWITDKNAHWHCCSGCEEKDSYADHDFENACDKDCSVCGYTRETEHKFSEAWTTDANNHWHECTGCGLKQDEAAHEPGPEATDTTAQTCTICGYEIAPALGELATEAPTTNEEVSAADNGGDFPWWIVLAAVAVLGIGAIVVVAIKKKKG